LNKKEWDQILKSVMSDMPMSISQITNWLSLQYGAIREWKIRDVGKNLSRLFHQRQVDRVLVDSQDRNARHLYKLGTGQEIDQRVPVTKDPQVARAVQMAVKIGSNGGRVVELTDKKPWGSGGQISGYGPKRKSHILGE
jgi:hypothetical protein